MIVVLGAGGLLGRVLVQQGSRLSHMPIIPITRERCDITDNTQLHETLKTICPSVIINAAGIVPKSQTSAEELFKTNSLAPKFLAAIADSIGAMLVHISTNCVFRGAVGNYKEDVLPYPDTLYGMSKLFGEVAYAPHLTIRTSFVGWPDLNGRGLLAWASQQKGEIIGYDEYLWNGVTTHELAYIIYKKLLPDAATGLVHVYGESISKADILTQAAKVYGWDYVVVPESSAVNEPEAPRNVFNRTLDSLYPYFSSQTFLEQLEEMKDLENT